MRWHRAVTLPVLLASTIGLATCGDDSSSAETESVFLPADAPTTEGNSSNQSPFKSVAGRYQAVYSAAFLGIPTGARITGMRFRLDGGEAAFPAATIANFEIRLSTSANPPGSLSTTFADNRGTDEVIVRTGALTIAPSDYPTGSVPNAFGPVIAFSPAFEYEGGPLLLEVAFTGLAPADARGTDNIFPATAEVQSGYGSVGGFDATTADLGLFQDLIIVEYQFQRD